MGGGNEQKSATARARKMAQKQKESGGGSKEERTGANFAEGREAADAKRAERSVWLRPFLDPALLTNPSANDCLQRCQASGKGSEGEAYRRQGEEEQDN